MAFDNILNLEIQRKTSICRKIRQVLIKTNSLG
jgi:hypothetical protein